MIKFFRLKNRKFENVAICVQLIKPVFWVRVHCTLLLLTIMSNKKSILISLHKQNTAYVIDTLIYNSLRLISNLRPIVGHSIKLYLCALRYIYDLILKSKRMTRLTLTQLIVALVGIGKFSLRIIYIFFLMVSQKDEPF